MDISVFFSLALIGLASAYDLEGGVIPSCDLSSIGSLPEHILPTTHELILDPDLETMTVDGSAIITLDSAPKDHLHLGLSGKYSSRHIYLHADESVNITRISIRPTDTYNRVIGVCRDAKNQLIDVHLDSKLKKIGGEIIKLYVDFNVEVRKDGKGIYQAEENGTKYIRTNFGDGGVRYAFPSFDDARFKSMIKLTIASDRKLYARSSTPINAILDIFRDHKDLRQMTFAVTRPAPISGLEFMVGKEEVIRKVDLTHKLSKYVYGF